jgi:hypothetical protein
MHRVLMCKRSERKRTRQTISNHQLPQSDRGRSEMLAKRRS